MVKYVESQEIDRKIRESVEESVSAFVHQAMRAPLHDLHMDEDMTAEDQACSSSDADVGADHIPSVNLNQSWWK
nr:hypothetical protein [Tanacetum cinerariifolium]